jgi:hypothetical protein
MPTPLRPDRPAMVTLPRDEALARIARHIAGIKRRMEALRTLLRDPDRPSGYVLHFKVNALRKEIHRWQAHSARIRRAARAEATIPEGLGT